jgi:hypothetical protein
MFMTTADKFCTAFLAILLGGCLFLLIVGFLLAEKVGQHPEIRLFG